MTVRLLLVAICFEFVNAGILCWGHQPLSGVCGKLNPWMATLNDALCFLDGGNITTLTCSKQNRGLGYAINGDVKICKAVCARSPDCVGFNRAGSRCYMRTAITGVNPHSQQPRDCYWKESRTVVQGTWNVSYACEYDPTTPAATSEDDDPSDLMRTFGWETKYNSIKSLMDDDAGSSADAEDASSYTEDASSKTESTTTNKTQDELDAHKAIHNYVDGTSAAEHVALAGAHDEAYQAIKKFMDEPITDETEYGTASLYTNVSADNANASSPPGSDVPLDVVPSPTPRTPNFEKGRWLFGWPIVTASSLDELQRDLLNILILHFAGKLQHLSVTPFKSYMEAYIHTNRTGTVEGLSHGQPTNSAPHARRRLERARLESFAVQAIVAGMVDVRAELDFLSGWTSYAHLRGALLTEGVYIEPILRAHVYVRDISHLVHASGHSSRPSGHTGVGLCAHAGTDAAMSPHTLGHCLRVGQQNKSGTSYRYSSSCSHVFCIFESGATRVFHHNKESHGKHHTCRHGLHIRSHCGCECYDEGAGDNYYMDILTQEARMTASIKALHALHVSRHQSQRHEQHGDAAAQEEAAAEGDDDQGADPGD